MSEHAKLPPVAGRPAPALTLDEARARIDAALEPLSTSETVRLADALGRVVARDVVVDAAVPGFDNSAMDGYALLSDGGHARVLRVVGESRAGHPYHGSVASDECVRIMTGAAMPGDCDAVVPFEDVTVVGERVVVPAGIEAGRHRRRAGDAFRPGDVAIAQGRILMPSDLGVLASIGRERLDVVSRARVAVFSTGDELRRLDEPLAYGSIRDQNRYTITGMLTRLGIDAIDLGIVTDDPVSLEETIRHACSDDVRADAIVTSGGVSSGDADYTRDVLRRSGDVAFWSLAIKPGRPMAFGRVVDGKRRAWLFALPGNPVAVMVVFYVLVRDALLKLMGAAVEPLPSLAAIVDAPIAKNRGRSEFVRGFTYRAADGWHVRPTGSQSSALLRSMSDANGLIALEHDRGPVSAGETVDVLPMHGLA